MVVVADGAVCCADAVPLLLCHLFQGGGMGGMDMASMMAGMVRTTTSQCTAAPN